MGIQGCSPPRHPRFCTHGPAMNTNHITNTYMHKIVVKTPCRIVEIIQLLEALPPPPVSGCGVFVPLAGFQMLYR